MFETVEAVREANFRKLDFNFCAQNTVFAGIGLLEKLQINRIKIEKKDGLYGNIKSCYMVCPFCVFYNTELL